MNAPFAQPHAAAHAETLLGPLPARRVVKKAVILAAGRGRRMGKLTVDRPKAALEVGGHALLDWQIAALQAAGVENIAVVTGHGADALAGRGVTYIHNAGWASGTQVETLLCASDWIGDEPVIVSYSDILYHPCAPLALLERPGDIVIAYDADHRWLWKQRFGNWLKDSETFVLGPGQVLTEIGGKPTDIEAIDGQFMGLMLFTSAGLAQLARRYRKSGAVERRGLDFTKLLAEVIAAGGRVDTAANLLPWMEVDGAKDLKLAQRMTERDELKGTAAQLVFPLDRSMANIDDADDEPDPAADPENGSSIGGVSSPANDSQADVSNGELWDEARLRPYMAIREYSVVNAFAIQNWGRSGSTFVQSLFDDHPQVLSTPNFYSRRYFIVWAARLGQVPDVEKVSVFLDVFRQWWDTGLVDATAGLHRLGPIRNEIAGVNREVLEGYLRAALPTDRPITRRSLFEAGHLAYALARGQVLAPTGLQILFAVHGEPRGVATAFLEDFPEARFIHTVREPVANLASSIQHLCFNDLDLRGDALEGALQGLFGRRGSRYGRAQTGFHDRPYFSYLQLRDAARLMKLEELHADGASLMSAAAQWLNLKPHDGLTAGTWDGKHWWNRPESGTESSLGGQSLDRNVANRLGPADQRRIKLLLAATPAVRVAYGTEARSSLPTKLISIVTPWRQEGLARRSEVRCVAALLKAAPFLPRSLVQQLRDLLARERHRARLLEMGSGSIGVRKKLSDARKPNTVRAVLVVTPTTGGWRSRALASRHGDLRRGSDRIAVAFLDDAIAERTVANSVLWTLILTVGWFSAQLATALRLRLLTMRFIFAGKQPAATYLDNLRPLSQLTKNTTCNKT